MLILRNVMMFRMVCNVPRTPDLVLQSQITILKNSRRLLKVWYTFKQLHIFPFKATIVKKWTLNIKVRSLFKKLSYMTLFVIVNPYDHWETDN